MFEEVELINFEEGGLIFRVYFCVCGSCFHFGKFENVCLGFRLLHECDWAIGRIFVPLIVQFQPCVRITSFLSHMLIMKTFLSYASLDVPGFVLISTVV